jgi:hypothetical protein
MTISTIFYPGVPNYSDLMNQLWDAAIGAVNHIGVAGGQGFGVGVCPAVPAGYAELPGTRTKGADDYGNYQYSDGSIMVWIPAFYYKVGTGANGLTLNLIDIKAESYFASVASANASGYALHRAFYDGGLKQRGVFVDKYLCSKNGTTASSIYLGNPLSSAAGSNPFSDLTGTPANNFGGAIAAAKSRGANFFCNSRFIFSALAMLATAHGQAANATTYCAWYSAGATNFPKGNNNTLVDINDSGVTFTIGSYASQSKAGSGVTLAKTTHNGQNCGIADLNGNLWEITPGLTSDGTNYYILKSAVQMKTVTGSNTLATDLWGATGIAALYTAIGAAGVYQGATAGDANKGFGSASQVLSEATSGQLWEWTGLGAPLTAGIGGSNLFGNDYFYVARPNELCPISGGNWTSAADAGVWALYLGSARAVSNGLCGFRAASYL